jgi:signal transduction histidine kinase
LTIKLPLKYKVDLKIVLMALLYYLSARLGYYLIFKDTTALPAWPPSGIAFALIILLGRASWPGITIGALVANIMAFWNNPTLPAQTIISASSFIAIGHTLETLAGNFFIKYWIKDDYPFTKAKNAFRFLFVTLLMGLIGSLVGTLSLNINGIVLISDFTKAWFSWWIGNVVGILLFTPFILSITRKKSFHFDSSKLVEVVIFAACLVAMFFLVRMEGFTDTLIRALPFLLIPFLLWMAFRFELLAAITGVLAISLLSIYFTMQGQGPFILSDSYNSMLLLQIFVGVISISTIVLSATVTERLKAERELLTFNETLEARVTERTQALHDEINTRKEAEEKLQKTNSELSKRNTELDNFVYSVSHDLRAPIASVLGLINLAKKDNDVEMKNIYLDKINNSALQQDNFIREILDQSRNSRLDVKKEEILFEPLIDETFNQLKFATSTGQSVERIVSVNQKSPFISDRWRIKVILNNIISNAIRYRNGKDPVIKVNVDIDDHTVKLEVEDNGKGIAKEHLDKVYRMFYRATDDGAGSGLGLYIVKEAIDKLNGSIRIESEVGKGTTVKLEIPEIV